MEFYGSIKMMLTKYFFNECDTLNKRSRYKISCRFPQLHENRIENKNAKLLDFSFLVFNTFLFSFSITGTYWF